MWWPERDVLGWLDFLSYGPEQTALEGLESCLLLLGSPRVTLPSSGSVDFERPGLCLWTSQREFVGVLVLRGLGHDVSGGPLESALGSSDALESSHALDRSEGAHLWTSSRDVPWYSSLRCDGCSLPMFSLY